MFRPGSLAVFVLLAASCSPAAAPPRAPEPAGGVAHCLFKGNVKLAADDAVYAGAAGDAAIARSGGGDVGLVVDAIEADARAHAAVRVPAEGPALVITGWIPSGRISLRTVHELSVVGRSILIAPGSRVAIRSASGPTFRVSAVESDFRDVAATASCKDVMIGPAFEHPKRGDGEPYHLVREPVRLFERAFGALVVELHPSRPGPTFEVDASRRGMKHVRYHHGVVIDGWMNGEDLEAGEGPDCDHCYGHDTPLDSLDRCTGGPEDEENGCPDAPRARAMRQATVTDAPGGKAIGVLEIGAEVLVVKESPGFARVATPSGVLRPQANGGFWVEEASLARVPR